MNIIYNDGMKIGRLALNLLKIKVVLENRRRCKGLVFDPKYNPKQNIPYMNDNKEHHKFDVYYTSNKDKKNCLVIDIHGGAYLFGHRQENYEFGTVFLDAGFDFIAIDYIANNGRRSVNDIVDQCVKCITYIANHMEELGFPKDYPVVLTGDSAGGHLASTITELFLDKKYASLLGHDLPSLNIKALAINCPVFKFVGLGDGLSNSGMKRMFGPDWRDESKRALICPAAHVDSLTVPLFVSTCKNDFLRPAGAETTIPAMERKSNKFVYYDLDDDDPMTGHVHNILDIKSEASKKVNNAMIDFFIESL